MASIRKEIMIDVPPEQLWDSAPDVGAPHTPLVQGWLTDGQL